MAHSIIEIARHELWVVLRTKRAVIFAALYVGLTIVGGLAYMLTVREI